MADPLFVFEREDGAPIALPAGRHVLGSQAELTLEGAGVEPQHVVLTVTAERVFCEVRSPRLGFVVNGEEARSRALKEGDLLQIGVVELSLRRVAEVKAEPRGPTTELIRRREQQSTLEQHYARLISGATATVRQLELFYRLSRLVDNTHDTRRFGAELLDLVLDVIPGTRAFLVVAAPGDEPKVIAARPPQRAQPGPSKTILGRVFNEGVSLITTDAQQDPRLSDSASIVIGAIRTALCAPLRSGEVLLGALYVDASDPGRAPTAEHLTILESVASYAALALSRARAYEALRQREVHTHLLVHDLKNPLSNVQAATDFLETLLPEDCRDTVSEALGLIRSSGRRLEGYISDILAVAQLEEAGLSSQGEEQDLELIAAALSERWNKALSLRRMTLEVSVEPAETRFTFDGRLIDRVVDNLLDNAVQHAPSASTLRVRFERVDDVTLEVTVGDEGPGVPPEMRDKIFDKFARVEDRTVGGRGFGLYFCRLAVRAHGGEIGVEGEAGDNRFVFTLRAPGSGEVYP